MVIVTVEAVGDALEEMDVVRVPIDMLEVNFGVA